MNDHENLSKAIARLKRSNVELERHIKELLLNYDFRAFCENYNTCIDIEGIHDAMIECNVARKLVSEAEATFTRGCDVE